MSHLIEKMAYVGQAPWHQIGNELAPCQPIEVWAEAAGMNWSIEEAPVRFRPHGSPQDHSLTFDNQKVLYRSDNHAALSVVGNRYNVVQPREVLEFYRDLTEIAGYELETAGVLKGGRKLWALAKTGQRSVLKGSDLVQGYLLLATACDGSLATIALPTTVRVVCNNTLAVALQGSDSGLKVPHSTPFDPDAIKKRLGIAVACWDNFMHQMRELSECKVKSKDAELFFTQVFSISGSPNEVPVLINERAVKRSLELYQGAGRGAELSSAKGTTWGLLNAVTEFVDHERRARSPDFRLDSAWFGQGALLKQRALKQALQLVS